MEEAKVKISFLIPKKMEFEMVTAMLKDGYNSRLKSEWICESVEDLLNLDEIETLVYYASNMTELNCKQGMYVPRPIKLRLDKLSVEIKKKSPELEGLQSAIIRASIIQRLIGERPNNRDNSPCHYCEGFF